MQVARMGFTTHACHRKDMMRVSHLFMRVQETSTTYGMEWMEVLMKLTHACQRGIRVFAMTFLSTLLSRDWKKKGCRILAESDLLPALHSYVRELCASFSRPASLICTKVVMVTEVVFQQLAAV